MSDNIGCVFFVFSLVSRSSGVLEFWDFGIVEFWNRSLKYEVVKWSINKQVEEYSRISVVTQLFTTCKQHDHHISETLFLADELEEL